MKKKAEKNSIIDELEKKLVDAGNFYLTDISDLNAEATYKLRKLCFKNNVELEVVKNSFLQKALERLNINDRAIYSVLEGHTSIMFAENANTPAKTIKEFRATNSKPLIKAAYVQECLYMGDDQLDVLVSVKSKEELIGQVIGLLQSPAQNVISALQSGKHILGGVIKTLADR